jgi:undecaprenyl-diphosphatase
MDWRLYRAIYDVSLHHHWLGSLFSDVESASIPLMVVATVALWFLARPGASPKWKLATASALGSAALALAVNRVVSGVIWHRDRPYQTHAIAHPWSSSTDASFPSDHASASFAIAFAVLLIDPLAGAIFLVAAVVIAVGRLFIGAHYPGDVGAGLLVGLAAALVVAKLLRPVVCRIVDLVGRLTDPLLAPIWRLSHK